MGHKECMICFVSDESVSVLLQGPHILCKLQPRLVVAS